MSRPQAFIGLAFISIVMLGGCGVKTDPVAVLAETSKSMGEIEQFDFSGQFDLVGMSDYELFDGLKSLSVQFDGKASLASPDQIQSLINLWVDGSNAEGSTRIGAEVRSFPDYNYFRITDVAIPLDLPFALTTDNKWYKVRRSTESADNVLGANPNLITASQWMDIRNAIQESRLFLAEEVLPEETVNGIRTYHLRAIINRSELEVLIDKIDEISDGNLGIDKNTWMKIVDGYVYDLWIAKRDFKITKLRVSDTYIDGGKEVNFDIVLNLTHFDTPVDIAKPSDVEEFSLDKLFGLPLSSL